MIIKYLSTLKCESATPWSIRGHIKEPSHELSRVGKLCLSFVTDTEKYNCVITNTTSYEDMLKGKSPKLIITRSLYNTNC